MYDVKIFNACLKIDSGQLVWLGTIKVFTPRVVLGHVAPSGERMHSMIDRLYQTSIFYAKIVKIGTGELLFSDVNRVTY